MKTTIGKIMPAHEAMSKLLDIRFTGPENFKKLFAIARMHRAMQEAVDFFSTQQRAIVEKNHGTIKDGFATFMNADGTVNTAAVAAVTEDLARLSETEVPDFPDKLALPLSIFPEDAQLSARELMALSEFIDFEEG